MSLTPPHARKIPHSRSFHGHTFIDNFEWLRNKEDPQTIEYLEAENAFTAEKTEHLSSLRETIFNEIKNRTQETDLSVPVREGQWWYYARTVEGEQYARQCRAPVTRPGSGSDDWTPPNPEKDTAIPGEQLLLNSNIEAEGHNFFSLGSFDISHDGNLLLYTVDTVGDERFTLHIRDLRTGENLPDTITNVHSAIFAPTGDCVFYTTVDDAWRPDTVWRHDIGSPTGSNAQIFTEPDERFWVGIGTTRSQKFVEIGVGSKITSETLLIDANAIHEKPRIVWPRREGVDYSVEHAIVDGKDILLILHNDGAENFELVSVPAKSPGTGPRNATVLMPHNSDIRQESVSAFANFIALEYRRNGLTQVAIAHITNNHLTYHELTFTEPIFTVGLGGNPSWEQPTLRLGYGSLLTPTTVYDYVVETDTFHLRKQQPVLGEYDPTQFREHRTWATAPDGIRIPISLVWKTPSNTGDTKHSNTGDIKNAPLLLYGYGSYEASIDPSFSISRLSLLDRGIVFAIAHVRGGGELGRSWYETGKKLTKKNTFTDFISCAQHLIDTGWTTPAHLIAEGGSAGGLLMGAIANQAPQLFAGILAEVPFVDPLTTMLDPSLPLTVIEWDEWGNPCEDPTVYEYMRSYSPYENITDNTSYPRILAVTSLNDTRVLYVEPAKWVARLREAQAPVLLKTEMSAGHGGVSGRYKAWEERAFELAWILDVVGKI